MNLTLQIAAWPLWQSGLLLVGLPTLLAMCGPVIVRRLVGLEALVGNNEVAGFKFATLGVIYAVLLGLAVIAVWDKFSDADGATTQEAAALASLYRLASGLDPEPQLAMHDALSRYAKSVIDDDWPAMARGLESEKTLDALNGLYGAALALDVKDARDAVLLDTVIVELDRVTEARRVRVGLGEGIVPSVVWLVLIAGAATTLGFTFFFGLENTRAQVLMTGMLAVVIFLALFVAISINHPFTGPVHVGPESIERVLAELGSSPD